MDVELSAFERWLGEHEGTTSHDLAHSGVEPLLDFGPLPAEPDLVARIADLHDVPEEEVVVTSGASEAAFLAAAAVVRYQDEVAVESPTYPPLAQGPALLGARVHRFRRTFDHGFAAPAAPVPGARLTTYSSPHNPSGVPVAPKVVARTAERTGGFVLADEVFRLMSDEPAPTLRHAHPRVLAVGSLTKAHGLPGVRIGWLVAPAPVAERARAVKSVVTFAPSRLDQAMAARALDGGLHERAVERRRVNLPLVEAAVRKANLSWVRPPAGVTCAVAVDEDDLRVAERLREAGVLVVPGSTMGHPGILRLGFGGATEDLKRALDGFVAAMGG